ncbi:hypothetical protein PUN28_005466 [Cardiocondyla obscurior]|uniref:Uncharacterized protein n=1 Tax=Cardiocondyla obscurior TaxID=286306 RepID=A0AAW2GLA0_9HYME
MPCAQVNQKLITKIERERLRFWFLTLRLKKKCPRCVGGGVLIFVALSSHKYENTEKDQTPPSTSRRSSLDNSIASRKKKKRTKSKTSRHGSKNSKTSPLHESRNCRNKKCQASRSVSESTAVTHSLRKLRTINAESNTFVQVPGGSQDYRERTCTCREKPRGTRRGNSHGHKSPRSASAERSEGRRKRSRRRRKKALKRETNRPRHDCLATLCACVRGRSPDEPRACERSSSREIPSRHGRDFAKDGQKEAKRATRKSILKKGTQADGRAADPSTSERKSVLECSSKLSPAKPKEERNVIIRGLNIVRKGTDGFGARIIRLIARRR